MKTFDEYWNDPDRARASVGLYTEQIARAAYEAGARETGAEVERLREFAELVRQSKTSKATSKALAEAAKRLLARAAPAGEDR